MVETFSREAIAEQCRAFGGQVGPLPAGVDGAQLLWGLSGNESSFGANCTPRHEPAFDTGGELGANPPMPELIAKYGSPAAASSYGPWQVMLCNAPVGTSPEDFEDVGTACGAAVFALNAILGRRKPQSLDEIGECYNTGKVRPDPVYVARLEKNYATAMPAEPNLTAGGVDV